MIMNRKHILTFTLLVVVLLSGVVALHAGGYYLNVSERIQEHSNWCWAGSSQCILYFKGTYPSQCSIANYAWSRSDCCGNSNFYWSHSCNQANGLYGSSGSIEGILENWGVYAYGGYYYLYWSTCQSNINSNRPFVMRFGWSGGGGHFLVCYGYWTDSGTNYLGYMDPWPGEGYTWSTYNWTVSSSGHSWTHTLRLN